MNAKTEQAKHTPGPWEHLEDGFIHAENQMVADPHCSNQDPDEREANARRIVACVNACEGISTEALEQGVVKELLEAAKLILGTAGSAWETRITEGECVGGNWDVLGPRLKAAVAKAEGRKEPAPRKDSTWDEELTWESRPLEGEV